MTHLREHANAVIERTQGILPSRQTLQPLTSRQTASKVSNLILRNIQAHLQFAYVQLKHVLARAHKASLTHIHTCGDTNPIHTSARAKAAKEPTSPLSQAKWSPSERIALEAILRLESLDIPSITATGK